MNAAGLPSATYDGGVSAGQDRVRLPVRDIRRATSFYCELLGIRRHDDRSLPISFRCEADAQSARNRLQVQVGAAQRLEKALEVAWERGGKIIESMRRIGKSGWRATIVDSEGNLVVLYSLE